MIRGAIEIASKSLVSGWLYSEVVDLKGKVVLAFVGDRYVGSGRIEVFRRDLKEAGLGNGFSGFYFKVELAADEKPGAIVVRLDHSDLALMQRGSVVGAPSGERTPQNVPPAARHREAAL